MLAETGGIENHTISDDPRGKWEEGPVRLHCLPCKDLTVYHPRTFN